MFHSSFFVFLWSAFCIENVVGYARGVTESQRAGLDFYHYNFSLEK